MTDDFKVKIGLLIQEARAHRGYTQTELAKALGTSQSAINRIEKGGQNISLEMISRISEVLSSNIVSLNQSGKINFRVQGGKKLSGSIEVKTSKTPPSPCCAPHFSTKARQPFAVLRALKK